MKLASLLVGVVLASCSSVAPDTFSLDCPGVTRHAANVETILVVGHRGAAAHEVENTIPSFERAMRDGANAVELDLVLTKDGRVVVWHDWDPDSEIALARQAGTESGTFARPWVPDLGDEWRRPADELTLAELRAHYGYAKDGERIAGAEIATLEEFLAWARTKPDLQYVLFDLKIPEDKAHLTDVLLDRLLPSVAGASFRFVLQTPYVPVWERASFRLGPGDDLAYDVDPGVVIVDEGDCTESSSHRARLRGRGYASTVKPIGWSAQAWKKLKRLLTCDLEARDGGIEGVRVPEKVLVATIDERDKMECLLDLGVDGVVTDDPALLREVTRTRAKR